MYYVNKSIINIFLMSKVLLEVPYHSQLNNKYNPTGSCNVTSAAMVVKYVYRKYDKNNKWLDKFPAYREQQLEDEMYRVMRSLGLSRHSPHDISTMIGLYGVQSRFDEFATIAEVKKHLDSGYPVICHGYFTSFGHIIVFVGYDDDKETFIVHDPYGEYWSNGYDNSKSGENLEYSYNLIRRTCIESDKSFWIHFVKGLK